MEVCSIGERVYFGHKEVQSFQLEFDDILVNVNSKVPVHGEEEDREEVVPEVWNIEDIGEFHLLLDFTIDHWLKDNTPYALGEDRCSISQLDLHVVRCEVPDPVMMRGHVT